MNDDWQNNLLTTAAQIRDLLAQVRTVAVLGIKTEAQADQPAFYVPKYLVENEFDVIPVPVYYPEATHILGRPVHRKLMEIARPVDLVNVFRRSKDVTIHLKDILAKPPKAVWMQTGIRDDATAEQLAKAGVQVVQDRCLMVEHRNFKAALSR